MKTIMRSMGVLILSLVVTTAFGQQRGQGMRQMDPEDMANRQLEQMKEIIKLKNDKEEKAVKEVFVKYAKERQKMFSEMQQGGDREANREKMQEMTNKQNEELKGILGEERFTTYNEKMQELRRNRQRIN
jgi:protein CpxP